MTRPAKRPPWKVGDSLPYPADEYVLTARDAATQLGCTVGAVYQLTNVGRLSVVRVGAKSGPGLTHNRYHPAEIALVLSEREVKPYRTILDPQDVSDALALYKAGMSARYCAAYLEIGNPRFRELLDEHGIPRRKA